MPTITKQYVVPFRKESDGTLKKYVYASSASVIDLDGYTPYTDTQIQQDPPDITAQTSLRDAIKIIDGKLRILDRDKGPHVTIPEATNEVSGTVIIGSNLTLNNNVLSLTSANVTSALGYTPPTTNTTYGPATTEESGLMSYTDKIKLNGIEAGANAYTLPEATDSILGGVKAGNNVTVDADGTLHLTSSNITGALGYTPPQTDTTYDAMTAAEATAGSETGSRVISPKVLSDLVDERIDDTDFGVTSVTTGTTDGTISVTTNGTTTDVSVNGLGSAAFADDTDFAAASHEHDSAEITSMGSYTKPLTSSAIAVTDTLDEAIGKLETALDGKANILHNQASNTIDAMTGYSKASEASAIETTDTLNEAIGKLEKALDGKQASGSYLTTDGIAADSYKLGAELASAYALKSDITTGSADGTIAVDGTNVAVSGLGSAAYSNTTAFAAASHGHDGSEITSMTGYIKPETSSDIGPTDSLFDAIGKLEKAIDNANVPPSIVTVVETGTTDGTISVTTSGTTEEVAVAGLGSAAYADDTDFAAASHNQASNTIDAMTGYSKAGTASAILATDTLNEAIGKLEKALDGKANILHNQASNTIDAMTGYIKADTASAIETTDTLNEAIGKLEKALEGKQASGSYLTTDGTAAKATADASGNVITTTYATKAEVSAIPKFKIQVVETLPATGDTATIYLVTTGTETDNLYTEYIYTNDDWEKLGTQAVDLSGYALKSDITTGSSNGTIAVDGTDVSVKGLGSAAYTASTAYAASGHNHSGVYTPYAPSVGSNTKHIYTNASGVLTAADFEIWVTNS